MRPKDFSPLPGTEKFVRDFIPKLTHECDGLIFQPSHARYENGTMASLLKWKFTHLNSVDFLLKLRWRPGVEARARVVRGGRGGDVVEVHEPSGAFVAGGDDETTADAGGPRRTWTGRSWSARGTRAPTRETARRARGDFSACAHGQGHAEFHHRVPPRCRASSTTSRTRRRSAALAARTTDERRRATGDGGRPVDSRNRRYEGSSRVGGRAHPRRGVRVSSRSKTKSLLYFVRRAADGTCSGAVGSALVFSQPSEARRRLEERGARLVNFSAKRRATRPTEGAAAVGHLGFRPEHEEILGASSRAGLFVAAEDGASEAARTRRTVAGRRTRRRRGRWRT